MGGEGWWHSLGSGRPSLISNASLQVPGQRLLEGVICPQSEDMAHVPVSFEPGERRLEKGQWMRE